METERKRKLCSYLSTSVYNLYKALSIEPGKKYKGRVKGIAVNNKFYSPKVYFTESVEFYVKPT